MATALYAMQFQLTQAEASVRDSTTLLQENNNRLRDALYTITQLSGAVKMLKSERKEQRKQTTDLMVENRELNRRLYTAIGQTYGHIETQLPTAKERFVVGPRSKEPRLDRMSSGSRHAYVGCPYSSMDA